MMTDDEQNIIAFNKLDDDINDFLELEEGETVSGWVLVYQTTRFTSEPGFVPLQTASSYASSLGTTTETAVGMLRLASKRLESEATTPGITFFFSGGEED